LVRWDILARMTDARWIVLALAVALVAAGVVPLLARAGRLLAAPTRARRALDLLWLALPVGLLGVLVALVATS
jgi:hypothetical protein